MTNKADILELAGKAEALLAPADGEIPVDHARVTVSDPEWEAQVKTLMDAAAKACAPALDHIAFAKLIRVYKRPDGTLRFCAYIAGERREVIVPEDAWGEILDLFQTPIPDGAVGFMFTSPDIPPIAAIIGVNDITEGTITPSDTTLARVKAAGGNPETALAVYSHLRLAAFEALAKAFIAQARDEGEAIIADLMWLTLNMPHRSEQMKTSISSTLAKHGHAAVIVNREPGGRIATLIGANFLMAKEMIAMAATIPTSGDLSIKLAGDGRTLN